VAAATAVALLVPFTAPVTATAAPVWRVVDLGAGDNSVATAVNDLGHIVGERDGTAFLLRHGEFTDLGPGQATDVNNRDEVVGTQFGAAFLWRDGVRTYLPPLPGGSMTVASGINDRGDIVGLSSVGDYTLHAVRWRAGVVTDLGSGYQYSSEANDINNRGQIVGMRHLGPNFEEAPVRWWHGTLTQLHEPRGDAIAVSESGAITGLHWGSWGTAGFLWHRGEFIELADLQPYGINDRVQVVGASSQGALLWQDGRTTVLPVLVSTSVAYDINDRGLVVGYSSVQSNGLNSHAVLWARR
jgi:probable HAF family extracellular repeat protein